MEKHNIVIDSMLNSKECLLKIVDEENGRIHETWMLEDGKIMGYEHIPQNYPSGYLFIWNNKQEYIESIIKVDWIINPENKNRIDQEFADELFAAIINKWEK